MRRIAIAREGALASRGWAGWGEGDLGALESWLGFRPQMTAAARSAANVVVFAHARRLDSTHSWIVTPSCHVCRDSPHRIVWKDFGGRSESLGKECDGDKEQDTEQDADFGDEFKRSLSRVRFDG